MMPKTSWDRMVLILACVGSGRYIVSREPDAVTICCSLVPANCPSMACVIDVGGWIVREYMNMELVVAMIAILPDSAQRLPTRLSCICRQS